MLTLTFTSFYPNPNPNTFFILMLTLTLTAFYPNPNPIHLIYPGVHIIMVCMVEAAKTMHKYPFGISVCPHFTHNIHEYVTGTYKSPDCRNDPVMTQL